MDSLITKLYKLSKMIVTTKDLALIWHEQNNNRLKAKTSYYVKRGALIRLSRGIFTKDKNYDIRELGNSIYSPTYLSFETALREAGLIFQYYESVFVAGPRSREVTIDNHVYFFRKLKDTILFNPKGIIHKGGYSIAGPERAFLDTIYLFPNYYFDNLSF